jgi:hypothetical protein
MRPPAVFALVLVLAACSATAFAGEQPNESKLTIVLDHAKLTKWVLEEFPDGLRFEKDDKPTDEEKARDLKFWTLIADWPVNVSGQTAGLAPAISQVCAEAGLPVFFTPGALKALQAAGTQRRMFTISDSVRKAVVIIARLAGVEKAVVMPFGLVVVGPGEGDQLTNLIAAPPRPEFRWRANYTALFRKAFPNGIAGEKPTDEELKKVMQIATSTRCDLVVPGTAKVNEFIRWITAVSQQTFSIDEAAYKQAIESGKTIGPVDVRFVPFLNAINAALNGTGLAATAEATHFKIGPAKPENSFRWRESYWAKIHEELGEDWDWADAPDEERQRVCEIVAETHCDLIVVEEMVLREFLRWLAESSQMNIVIDPVVFQTSTPSSPLDPGEEFPAGTSGLMELPETRTVEPITLRSVSSRDAVTAALEPLKLRAVPGGNGGLLIIPAEPTEEELEH